MRPACFPEPLWVAFPESGWIHGWSVSLTDASGEPVTNEAIHHFRVLNPARRELFGEVMMSVIGSGSETTPVMLPTRVGHRMEEGDSLLVTAMLHNPTHGELRGVRLAVTLRYSPEGDWNAPLDVMPFHVHVAPDMNTPSSYDVAPRSGHRTPSTFRLQWRSRCWVSGATSTGTGNR